MNEIAKIISINQDGKVKFKKSSGEIQIGQIFLPYGFFSNIKITENSLVLIFYVDGGKDYPLVCPINIIKQPKIESGQIQVGGFDNQPNILIKDNSITITATNTKIEGDLEINGNITINNDATITGQATITGKNFLNHTHSAVMSGTANSGPVS
jgi:hypothetical protein